MPGQNEPSTYVDHLDFLLYSTQHEADRARTKANLEHFALVIARVVVASAMKGIRTLQS
jgi:hypothetical protein